MLMDRLRPRAWRLTVYKGSPYPLSALCMLLPLSVIRLTDVYCAMC